ncbi:LOW QUALITY PROTEIN: hypothetical protein GQ55_4G134900 [Panicum hallii var. hallii]|uniref:WRKY domain-containing protein n=1 Tax=Panicum hallii var. hallii TaxID=1504633 RepID=A0A2T7DY51_9POAL|nr:LOW QUALITY PROTEIN: hypothetical protein GQ55_4G134900 [Panicum hallii var. hallii]
MEGDLRWCCGSSSNNWDQHAVVRFACGGGGRVTPPPASDESFFSWLCRPCHSRRRTSRSTPWRGSRSRLPPPWKTPACRPSSPPRSLTRRKTKRRPSSRRPNHELPTATATAADPHDRRGKEEPGELGGDAGARRRTVTGPLGVAQYGQKPIKGSLYPRGYYRCSNDKDCKARKQVERCRADHTTLLVSCTGEHSHPVPLHRNSLAATTRNKPQPPSSTSAGEEPPQPQVESSTGTKQQGSPSASAGLSPTTPLHYCPPAGVEHEEEVEEEAVAAILLLKDAEMEVGGAHPPGSAPV